MIIYVFGIIILHLHFMTSKLLILKNINPSNVKQIFDSRLTWNHLKCLANEYSKLQRNFKKCKWCVLVTLKKGFILPNIRKPQGNSLCEKTITLWNNQPVIVIMRKGFIWSNIIKPYGNSFCQKIIPLQNNQPVKNIFAKCQELLSELANKFVRTEWQLHRCNSTVNSHARIIWMHGSIIVIAKLKKAVNKVWVDSR